MTAVDSIVRPWAAVIAGVIGLADGVLYLVLIHDQGDPTIVVPFVAAFIALAAVGAFWGWIASPAPKASVLLSCSTILFFVLGVLGIFSIGLPLLLASAFSLLGVFQSRRAEHGSRLIRSSTGVAAMIGIILAGFFLTQVSGDRETASVSCEGAAQGSGVPALEGGNGGSTPEAPHPCINLRTP